MLATPPAHHAPATLDLVGRGFHVFVEKPMAIRAADAEAMVLAADAAGVVLSVGLYRRLLPVTRLLRGMLEHEMLGRPIAVDIEEGGEYSWELATLSVLTREGGGGGVLIDLGTHLSTSCSSCSRVSRRSRATADNARGGIETDCELELALGDAVGRRAGPYRAEPHAPAARERFGSQCEHGTFELIRGDFCTLLVHGAVREVLDDRVSDRPRRFHRRGAAGPTSGEIVGYKAFRAEFDDWIAAIAARSRHRSCRAVRSSPVVRTVEAC